MIEPSWWMVILISLVLSIPVGVGINLITPALKIWWTKRVTSTRYKTLEQLKADFSYIETLYRNPDLFNLTMSKEIIYLLFIFFTGALCCFVQLLVIGDPNRLVWASMVFFSGLGFRRATGFVNTIIRVSKFEEYKNKTQTRIQELELIGNGNT